MRESNNTPITAKNFAPLLKTVADKGLNGDIIRHGFRATGLFPFNPDNIDFRKCLKGIAQTNQPSDTKDEMSFKKFAEIVDEERIQSFKRRTTTGKLPHETEDQFLLFKLFTQFASTAITVESQDSDNIMIETSDNEFLMMNDEGSFEDTMVFDFPESRTGILPDNDVSLELNIWSFLNYQKVSPE